MTVADTNALLSGACSSRQENSIRQLLAAVPALAVLEQAEMLCADWAG